MKLRHKVVPISLIQSNILCRLGKVSFYNWKQIFLNAKTQKFVVDFTSLKIWSGDDAGGCVACPVSVWVCVYDLGGKNP